MFFSLFAEIQLMRKLKHIVGLVNQRPYASSFKRPYSATLFLVTCKRLAITLYSEHAEIKGITVKQLKIIKHTLRNTTYSQAIRFRFTVQYQ